MGHSVKGYIYVDTRKTKKKEERDNIVVLLRKGTSSWGGKKREGNPQIKEKYMPNKRQD